MGAVAEAMRRKLSVLSPTRLEIIDDSDRHAGHDGARVLLRLGGAHANVDEARAILKG